MRERFFDVRRLPAFVSTPEQQYARLAYSRVIHPVARSPVNTQLAQSTPNCLTVGEVAERYSIKANYDLRLRTSIPQLRQPLAETILSIGSDVTPKLNQFFHCNI